MAIDDRQDRYPFRDIEPKWQGVWEKSKQFRVTEDPGRPKYYCLEMFPYPSGRIHMGHVRVYTIGDLLARFKLMRGFNVLHPMGWDAFGLPAENAAIDNGVHPVVWTLENIANMKTQLGRLGMSYDWDRELATCDPAYYRWEQLIFIRMFERGLAYKQRSKVNWCPSCQTILANEQEVARESEIERLAADRPKRGLRLGARAVNPFTDAEIPLFLADYVLMGYGTGAIMAVPGEDQRDWEFAKQHGLDIVATVKRPEGWEDTQAYTGDGVKINSGFLDGLSVDEAKRAAIDWLVRQGIGRSKVNYRLRDWGISRQRYWGAPIPILYCETCGMVPEREENLPVVLPQNVQISGKGGSPLAGVASFVNATCPRCGGKARRDTDTMDTFVESSWYFLRYCSPHYDERMFERAAAEYWMPVDQYIGGIEHAVLHLLYARFFTKVLRDLDLIALDEPFRALLSQGMVIKDGAKMSKSKGNVVDPDDMIRRFGADATRLFTLFAAPPERDLEWTESGVEGASRFLNRLWRFVHAHADEIKGGGRVPGTLSDAGR